MMMVRLASFGALLAAIAGSTAYAQTQAPERKPSFAFSIANPTPNRTTDGPLFKRMKEALDAANQGDGAGFTKFIANGAQLFFTPFSEPERSAPKKPFDARAIQAVSQSCLGPYSFDEAAGWAEVSWVCREDSGSKVSRYMTFHNSPELTVTVWFENGLIKAIDAMEPIPLPGMRHVSMGAYSMIKNGAKLQ